MENENKETENAENNKKKSRRKLTESDYDAIIKQAREKKQQIRADEKRRKDRERTSRLINKGAFIEAIFGEMTLEEARIHILKMRKIARESGAKEFQYDELDKKEKLISSGSKEIKGRQLEELQEIIELKNKEV